MIAVLDTNVFISGMFWEGNFWSQIIDKWKRREIELVSSLDIVGELVKTLKGFKIPMPEDMIEEWKNLIIKNSTIVESLSKIDLIMDDSEDNKFLEAAIDGKADLIISQDHHLLNLKEYKGIKIVKPEDAINLILN